MEKRVVVLAACFVFLALLVGSIAFIMSSDPQENTAQSMASGSASTDGIKPGEIRPDGSIQGSIDVGAGGSGGASGGMSGGESGASGGSNGGNGAEDGGRGAFLTNETEYTGDKHYCSSLDLSNCQSVLESVCGWYDTTKVSCTEGPCVKRYTSECNACADTKVVYWTEGECPFHG
jgi:hypothetical protein